MLFVRRSIDPRAQPGDRSTHRPNRRHGGPFGICKRRGAFTVAICDADYIAHQAAFGQTAHEDVVHPRSADGFHDLRDPVFQCRPGLALVKRCILVPAKEDLIELGLRAVIDVEVERIPPVHRHQVDGAGSRQVRHAVDDRADRPAVILDQRVAAGVAGQVFRNRSHKRPMNRCDLVSHANLFVKPGVGKAFEGPADLAVTAEIVVVEQDERADALIGQRGGVLRWQQVVSGRNHSLRPSKRTSHIC
ncbi:hypothetical protein ERY430_30017 [Erythrobacter sp. EC-HK427]|nr:hypothetical protein ERY430_30017 [Erythrobacter sp. EC-HK427]